MPWIAAIYLWGGVKLILADRLGILSQTLLSNPIRYVGWELIVGVIAYTLQIYCDFSSYSDMACGVARILGFDIIQNFKRPYFATSIADFWRRWHISLSSWLKDYIYIPLGGSKKGTIRRFLNLGIVFLASGIWHGVGWNFIFWGLLYAVYYVISYVSESGRKRIKKVLHIDENNWSYKTYKRMLVFILVAFAWIFFYGPNINSAWKIVREIGMLNNIGILFSNNALEIAGFVNKDWLVIMFGLSVLFFIDIMREKRINIYKFIDGQNIIARWIIYIGMMTCLIIFGIYGPGYKASAFLYQAF